jgi:hypothetical protein
VADIFTIGLSQGMTGGNSFGDGGGEKGIDFVFGMVPRGRARARLQMVWGLVIAGSGGLWQSRCGGRPAWWLGIKLELLRRVRHKAGRVGYLVRQSISKKGAERCLNDWEI